MIIDMVIENDKEDDDENSMKLEFSLIGYEGVLNWQTNKERETIGSTILLWLF